MPEQYRADLLGFFCFLGSFTVLVLFLSVNFRIFLNSKQRFVDLYSIMFAFIVQHICRIRKNF